MAEKAKEFKGFEKSLREIANRFSLNQVFDDFLKMTVCAFSIGSMEDEYKRIASKYNAAELQLFSESLAELTEEYHRDVMCDGWGDVLGDVFETFNSSSQASNSGQFFTPKTICNLMSKITHDESFIPNSVNDCACGSGRNLLAHRALREEHRLSTFYTAQDIDERCVLMSVINFVMHGMKGVVIHMNALTLEVFGGYRIYLPETGLFVKPMTIDQCKYYLFEHREIEDAAIEPQKIELSPVPEPMKQAIAKGQLSLFD